MLCTNPRESELLAKGRLRDGIQPADQARLLQRVGRTTLVQRGVVSGLACLVP